MRSDLGVGLVLLLAIFALLKFGPLPHRTNIVMKYVIGAVLVLSLLAWAFLRFVPAPRYVDTFKTPVPGLTLTLDTLSIPLTSDAQELVAHYEHNGKKDSKIILDGDDATFYRYVWVGSQRLEVCWRSGDVFNFTNTVDLKAGGGEQHFHVALREDCTPNP